MLYNELDGSGCVGDELGIESAYRPIEWQWKVCKAFFIVENGGLCAQRAGYRFEITYYIMIHNNLQNIIRNLMRSGSKAAVGTWDKWKRQPGSRKTAPVNGAE